MKCSTPIHITFAPISTFDSAGEEGEDEEDEEDNDGKLKDYVASSAGERQRAGGGIYHIPVRELAASAGHQSSADEGAITPDVHLVVSLRWVVR
jgi:hypothetical protein